MRNHEMTVRLDGFPIIIRYETEGDGSGPSYLPRYGADSGDPLVVIVLSAYSEEYGDVVLSQDEDDLVAAEITERHEFDDGGDLE